MENNLKFRFLSSFVLLLFLICVYLIKPHIFFFIFILALIQYELYTNKIVSLFFSCFSILLFLLLIYYEAYLSNLIYSYKFLSLLFLLSLYLLSIFLNKNYFKYIFFNFLIIFLLFLSSLLFQNNIYIFFQIIFLASLNDIIAFFSGKKFQGPKIIKSISPNKTWSGTTISYIVSFLILYILNFSLIFSLIIPLFYFFGDIYFSYFKRIIKIKDYSYLIKGHGGLLDRIDSSIFSLSVAFIFLI